MPAPVSFDYAVFRIVPRSDREEFINAGVILFCLQQRFLDARIEVDDARLLALWPGLDLDAVHRHLEAILRISRGDPDAGPVSQLSQRERFGWLTAPRSTLIQVSPVHTGMCEHPADALNRLFQQLIAVPAPQPAPSSGYPEP